MNLKRKGSQQITMYRDNTTLTLGFMQVGLDQQTSAKSKLQFGQTEYKFPTCIKPCLAEILKPNLNDKDFIDSFHFLLFRSIFLPCRVLNNELSQAMCQMAL